MVTVMALMIVVMTEEVSLTMSVAVVVAMTVADEMTSIVVGTLAAAAVVIGIAPLATVSVLSGSINSDSR